MNRILLSTLAVAAAAAGAGTAQAQELGRVISSIPVIQQVAVPRQVCTQQQVAAPASPSGGGAVVGAIVGGLLGNTVGGGSGRVVATGVGAVAGAAVGNSIEAGQQQQARVVQNCSTQTTYENRTIGYNVQYEYAGKQYQVQLPYDPGPTIKLQVTPISANPPVEGEAVASATGQPAAVILADNGPAWAQPAYGYAAYPAPAYVVRPWVPPVTLSLGLGWYGGHRHWH